MTPRDKKGRFTGGPRPPGAGRKKGSPNIPTKVVKRTAVEAAEAKIKALAGRAVQVLEAQLASEDPTAQAAAARLILQKVVADERHKGHAVQLPELAGAPTLTEKSAVIDKALGEGRITAEQAKTLLAALRDSAEIADIEQTRATLALVRKGKSLSEALELVDAHGPAIADAQLAKVISIVPHSN